MQKTSAFNGAIDLPKPLSCRVSGKKRSTRWLGLLGAFIVISGCSNHLYQGTTSYSYAGKICQAHVFWTNTTHVFDSVGKPSDVVVRLASTEHRFQFENVTGKDDALTVLLPANEYVDVINNSKGENVVLCGKFEGVTAHMQQSTNTTQLSFYCNKKSSQHGMFASHMLARKAPYVFEMEKPTTETSLFGNVIETNLGQPDCQVSNAPATRTDR